LHKYEKKTETGIQKMWRRENKEEGGRKKGEINKKEEKKEEKKEKKKKEKRPPEKLLAQAMRGSQGGGQKEGFFPETMAGKEVQGGNKYLPKKKRLFKKVSHRVFLNGFLI